MADFTYGEAQFAFKVEADLEPRFTWAVARVNNEGYSMEHN